MATPLLGLYAPADGSDQGTAANSFADGWGHKFVNGLANTLDNIIAAVQAITLSSGTVALTSAQAGAQMLRFTGVLTGNVTITNGGNLWNGIRCVENLTTGNFTVALSQSGSVNVPQNARSFAFLDLTTGPRLMAVLSTSQIADIPSGSVMPFYQTAAPTGWTISAALNDFGMRIINGTGGVTSGGAKAYSTVMVNTSTTTYALQAGDLAVHTHPFVGITLLGTGNSDFFVGSGPGTGGIFAQLVSPLGIPNQGGNRATGVVGATGTASPNPHSHPITMGVRTADFILASKN